MSASSPAALHASELLEREAALASLDAAYRRAMHGHGRLVLVSGEAGIGKTALVHRFCEDLRGSQRVLWGACDALFTPRPLGPIVEIAQVTGGRLESAVERDERPHEITAALLDELALEPTIVVVEDLHWADQGTLDVLRLLGRRLDALHTLVVASFRSDQLEPTHPLRVMLGETATTPAVDRIALEPLSAAAVARLAEPYGVDERELYARTGGNPFFVTEALESAGDRIPPTVRDAVLARAARLTPSARQLLELVAVAHPHTELWLVEREASLSDLDECMASGMVTTASGTVTFRHELARMALEESIAPGRALELHRSVLAALMSPPQGTPDLARLAHHAEGAGDRSAVLRVAPAAAEQAASVGAHLEAAAQYARALRFAGDAPLEERLRLLNRHSYECYLTAKDEHALGSIDEAMRCYRELGDDLGLGATLRWRSLALLNWGRAEEAGQAAREALSILEALPPSAELAMAYNARASVAVLDEDFDDAAAWASRALELAEAVDSTDARVTALGTLGLSDAMRGLPDGRSRLEEALGLARVHELESHAGRTYVFLAMAASRARSLSEMRRHVLAGLEFCEERDLDVWDDPLMAMRSWIELEAGAWDAASATVAQVHARNCILSSTQASIVLGLLRARRGDPDPWTPLASAASVAEQTGQLWWLSQVAAAQAEVAWLEGRPELVAGLTDRAFELARERRAAWPIAELAHWRRRAGIEDDLPDEAAGPFAAQARGEWASAVELWRAADCPYEAALALAEGDVDAQLQSLDELNDLGAAAAAGIVARRLRARGVRGLARGPRPATRESPAGLTPRESEVLHLLAEGLRNAEIAERLVVSRRTVDHHVSSILRKLDAGSRGEAVADARRRGLLEDR